MRDLIKLPDEVRARLGERGLAAVSARASGRLVEARAWTSVELRSVTDSEVRVVGYASTFDQPYDIYGGAAAGGFAETIAPGAFDKSLREQDDVRWLINHEGLALARTKSGTLKLVADDLGLLTDASLDAASPIVAGLRSALERGDVDSMSFAFEVTRQTWSPDYGQRRITEVKLYDVSAVTFPANDQTMVMAASADHPRPEPAAPHGRSLRLARAQWAHTVRS